MDPDLLLSDLSDEEQLEMLMLLFDERQAREPETPRTISGKVRTALGCISSTSTGRWDSLRPTQSAGSARPT
jgi:hypothetical protein